MPMRTKDDAIARLDEAITWLRGYTHGSGDGYTDSLAQELGRVKDWVQKISVCDRSDHKSDPDA